MALINDLGDIFEAIGDGIEDTFEYIFGDDE